MYITSIKRNVVHRQLSLVDELFEDLNPVIQSNYIETKTVVANCELRNSHNYESTIYYLKSKIERFNDTHQLNEMYTQFKIPKHTGGMRTIDAPNEELKGFMREISNEVQRKLKLVPHNSAYAYVKNRSVIDAVKVHQENKSRWFLKIDLKDFFGSCSKEFIVKQLSKIYPFAAGIEYENDLSASVTKMFLDELTTLSCLDNKLPQGTPMSPWLTNLVMVEFDYKITRMLNNIYNKGLPKQRYVYTRYADDILISAKEKFNYEIVIDEIEKLFINTPLTIKTEKTRFGSSSGRNWNLGIMYNKDGELTVGHKKKRLIKDNIYYFIKFKDNFSLDECQWLQGNIAWIQAVEPAYVEGLLKYYKDKFNVDVLTELTDKIKSFNN